MGGDGAWQAALAELGQHALVGAELTLLIDRIAPVVAHVLGTPYSTISELLPERKTFLIRACTGCNREIIGTSFPADTTSLAGLVLSQGRPLAVGNLASDARFSIPAELSELGIVSSAAVPIDGLRDWYGVLEVHTTLSRHFSRDELNFLQAAANILTTGLLRQEVEDKSRRTEEYYRSIIENILDVVTILDSDGVIQYQSPSVTRALGYQPGELLGRRFLELVHPDDTHSVVESFLGTLWTAGVSESVEFRMPRKDGTPRILEGSGRLLSSEERTCVLTFRDITQRKDTEEALRESEHRFRQAQKMEAIGRLAGGVAHDFNNVLTVIVATSEMLLAREHSDNESRHDIESIQAAAQRAAALTRQLLAFSRKQDLRLEVLDLNSVIRNVQTLLRRLLGEHIELVTLLDPFLGKVKCDLGQIEQVIMNLSVNARDAMPNGGRLIIETKNAELDERYASSHMAVQPGSYAMIAVTDSGIGMDEGVKAQIFEPFFTTKEVGKGTGLGLATVYGIVKQSEGNIWVYSEPGMGTTFRIYLPLVSDDRTPTESEQFQGAAQRGSGTVLVAEDDFSVRELARRILEMNGYRVLLARHGAEALQLATMFHGVIDLVVTDAVMPGMGGPDLIEKIRKIRPGTPVLYVSGYTAEALGRQGLLEPGVGFLPKPFSGAQLAMKVRELVGSWPENDKA